MKLLDYGNYVSWEHCIEANRICNVQNCPDTMNCCSTNCVGMPTAFGLLVFGGIALVILILIRLFYPIKEGEKDD